MGGSDAKAQKSGKSRVSGVRDAGPSSVDGIRRTGWRIGRICARPIVHGVSGEEGPRAAVAGRDKR